MGRLTRLRCAIKTGGHTAASGNSKNETLLVIGIEHAKTISGDGFSKSGVRKYIAETTNQYSEEDLLLMMAGR